MAGRPQLQPTTTRVGGGSSARLAAVALAAALAGLALIGLTGGEPASAPQVSLPPVATQVAEAPTAEPSATPTPRPERTTNPDMSLPNDPYSLILQGDDAYAVLAHFGGRHYLVFLYEHEAGHLSGRARMPFPRDAAEGEVEFLHLWTRQPPSSLSVIDSWPVSLDPLIPETTRSGTVLAVSQPADPLAVDESRVVRRGYELTIRAEGRSRFALLVVEVNVMAGQDNVSLWSCDSKRPIWNPRHDC